MQLMFMSEAAVDSKDLILFMSVSKSQFQQVNNF